MTKVFAHRGASGYAPENTLAAFQLAMDLGAEGIELDVQMTSDKELVVIHDETLDRTTNGKGWVKDHTIAQIKKLDASMGSTQYPDQTVPTLDEVFALLEDTQMFINIEIKNSRVPYPGISQEVLSRIDNRDWEHRVIISSFNHMTLAELRQLGSLVNTGMLFQDVLFEPWAYAHQLWATAMHPHFMYVDAVPNFVTEAHNSLLEVNVWTVNEAEDMDRMIGVRVDSIITNFPDLALERRRILNP